MVEAMLVSQIFRIFVTNLNEVIFQNSSRLQRPLLMAVYHVLSFKETFTPMLLQTQEYRHAMLTHCILNGDNHQLQPVVKNMDLQKYINMNQSWFTRFLWLSNTLCRTQYTR